MRRRRRRPQRPRRSRRRRARRRLVRENVVVAPAEPPQRARAFPRLHAALALEVQDHGSIREVRLAVGQGALEDLGVLGSATPLVDRPAAGPQRGLKLCGAEAVPRRRVVDEVGAVAVHEALRDDGRHEGKVLLARRLGGRRLGLERDACLRLRRSGRRALREQGLIREIWPRQVRPRRPRRGLGRPFPGLGHRSGRVGRRRRQVARRDRSAAAAARAVDLDPAVLVRPAQDLDHLLGVGVDLPRLVRLPGVGDRREDPARREHGLGRLARRRQMRWRWLRERRPQRRRRRHRTRRRHVEA